MMAPSPRQYYDLFQQNLDGQAILIELSAVFYDRQSFDKDPYQTAFNEGQRAVVHYILQKISQGQQQFSPEIPDMEEEA
jgi:hypothetical protein